MKKWFVFLIVMLVPLCLFACWQRKNAKPLPQEPIVWTPVYNNHECGVQASRTLPEGTTKRELTAAELASLVPDTLFSDKAVKGTVYFLADGSIYYLSMDMQLTGENASILLGSGIDWGGCCLSVTYEGTAEKTSLCGSTEYALFRTNPAWGEMLLATGKLNGVPMLVRIDAHAGGQYKAEFEAILEAFARFKAESLSISYIKP